MVFTHVGSFLFILDGIYRFNSSVMCGLDDFIEYVHLLASFRKVLILLHYASNSNVAIVDQIVHGTRYFLESAFGGYTQLQHLSRCNNVCSVIRSHSTTSGTELPKRWPS